MQELSCYFGQARPCRAAESLLTRHIVKFLFLRVNVFLKTNPFPRGAPTETAQIKPPLTSAGRAPLVAPPPHLFVQALQLHLQVLHEALPLNDLTLSSPQSLVALLHLALHHLQLEDRTDDLHVLWQKISF